MLAKSLLIVVLGLTTLNSWSQNLRLITPWSVGGGSDHATRTLSDMLEKQLNVNVIVENRSGANGALAGREVAKSGPERNTYLSDSLNMLTNAWFVKGGIGFDPIHDLVPVASLALQHHVLLVSSSLQVKSVKDLIVLARRYPGEITYGHSGIGAPHHIVGLILQRQGQVRFNEIGYRTTMAALLSVASGEIAVASGNLTAATPLIKTGRVRVIAKLSPETVLPLSGPVDVGTDVMPGLQSSSHEVLWAPATQNSQTLSQLSKIVTQIVSSQEYRDRLAQAGVTARPMSIAELNSTIALRIKNWRELLANHIVN